MLHAPRHTSEKYKLIKVYSDKYAAQQPYQDKEARSGGKPKHGKYVEFSDNTQEVKIMETYDDHILNNNNGKELTKKRKSEIVKTETAEVERNYGIDRLNLTETVHES